MTIKEHIEHIAKKYFNEEDECYTEYRYDDENNEFDIKEELKEYLDAANITYKLKNKEGFSSAGYDNSFLAIAWVEEDNIELVTILIECY